MKKLFKKIIKGDYIYLYIFVYLGFLIIRAFFRDATGDEVIYLRETTIISELIKKGIWFGDYAVGLHGFLFKLPVALLFILIRHSSVYIATAYTIFLSGATLVVLYKFLKKFFFTTLYSSLSVILFSVVFHYLDMSLSYNRDIPALFAVILFFYLFFNHSNRWLIGLSLLLLLDAKEHIFLTIAPFYLLYLIVEAFISLKIDTKRKVFKNLFIDSFSGYFPSILWVVLMFTTSIIPINMFLASIFGLIESGLDWSKSQFSLEAGTSNLLQEKIKEIPKITNFLGCNIYSNIDGLIKTSGNNFSCIIRNVLNTVGAYVGKIFYPTTFSFIAIPKIIALPAILVGIKQLNIWWKNKDKRYIFPVVFLFNIGIILFRASHGRYLLCIAPIFMVFFVIFIKDYLKDSKVLRNMIIPTVVFVIIGLFFESSYILPKIILELSLLFLLIILWYLSNKKIKRIVVFQMLFIGYLSTAMALVSLMFSFKSGQISTYRKYGYNRQTELIVENINREDVIWINDIGNNDLSSVFRYNMGSSPEWTWKLKAVVPKKNLLKIYSKSNTFTSSIIDMESFKKEIESNDINKVALIISTLENETFPNEDKLTELLSQDWIKYDRKVELKNKILFIFKVEK